MVRAYYMRLLCWRVGRYDGESNGSDELILETMLLRLQSIWAQYLWLVEDAVAGNKSRIPTNPCHPAPGRRLLIVRTDNPILNGRSFMSYDGIKSPPPAPLSPAALTRTSTLSLITRDGRPPGDSGFNIVYRIYRVS